MRKKKKLRSNVATAGSSPTGCRSMGCLKAALAYAKLGWRVVLVHGIVDGLCTCKKGDTCKKPGKHPVFKDWQQLATADGATIRGWFEDWPDSNVGVLTGPIFVLDTDPGHGGSESLKLIKAHGNLPKTPRSQTGGGGSHRFYKAPKQGFGSPSNVLPGIDIRCDGGLIILPPSRHKSGKEYEWFISPDECEIAKVPDTLLEQISKSDAKNQESKATDPTTTSGDNTSVGPKVTEGDRNSYLFRLGSSMRGKGLCDVGIRDALLAQNSRHCMPPLDEEEVAGIAARVATFPQPAPGPADLVPPPPDLIKEAICAKDLATKQLKTPKSIWGDGLLGPGDLGLLAGEPGTSKSYFALQLGLALAKGEAIFGLPTQQSNVVAAFFELTQIDLQARLRNICSNDTIPENLTVLTKEMLGGSVDVTDPATQAELIRVCKAKQAEVLILDPFSRMHWKEENSGKEMGEVLAALNTVRMKAHVAMLINTHVNKSQDAGRSSRLNSVRGSSRLISDPTLVMNMTKSGDHQRQLSFSKVNRGRTPKSITLDADEQTGVLSLGVRTPHGEELGAANRGAVQELLKAAGAKGVSMTRLCKRTGLSDNSVRKHAKSLGAVYHEDKKRWVLDAT